MRAIGAKSTFIFCAFLSIFFLKKADASMFTISETMVGSITRADIDFAHDPDSIKVGNKIILKYNYTYNSEEDFKFDYSLDLFSDGMFYDVEMQSLDTHHTYLSSYGLTPVDNDRQMPNGTISYQESDDGDSATTFFHPAYLPNWTIGCNHAGGNSIAVTFGQSMQGFFGMADVAVDLTTGMCVNTSYGFEFYGEPVPEPASILLFTSGVIGLTVRRRVKKNLL